MYDGGGRCAAHGSIVIRHRGRDTVEIEGIATFGEGFERRRFYNPALVGSRLHERR
jgi:hypothetical protein